MDEQKIERLTDRQKDCLRLVAQGFTSKEIGRLLDLSPSTVDNHVTMAVQLLGAPSRGAAARALASAEVGQYLPSQSPELADSGDSAMNPSKAEGKVQANFGQRLLVLPPVGGKKNDLDGTSRTLRILQVAVLATASAIALTILISGFFRTLG
ncbi:LuxR family transcriptional regulator [Sphingorhabdus pulchriflava]|uniref:LuxR family transcriptional regulator n=1 Tax=Sphingorhabdus pulchriflava TaxID=2292257 RepID=A0A371B224_9SPHN|nr:helix-turn-helix transcriptional regulator [Sphingorhabdus pulchriflava]RDV01608.1 LuxR family transcriptional regulator [Sphingorhabdus pulchriflava]